MRLGAIILLLGLVGTNAKAFDLIPSVSSIHNLESNYHHLGYGLSALFPLGKQRLRATLGTTHPYAAHGFRQQYIHGDVCIEWWERLSGTFNAFVGLGFGGYVNQVSTGTSAVASFVPSFVIRGGIRAGGRNFGAELAFEDYSGIYTPGHLPFTIWFLLNVRAGVYVSI